MLRLAVFHRSEDVQAHLVSLQQIEGVELAMIWQGTTWTIPRGVMGVLWELSAEDAGDSRIAALIEGVPAASYSPTSMPALADVSRSLGFRKHLPAPLRLFDVERALGVPAVIDLADRLDAATPKVARLARRPEAVSEVLRAVNASTDPVGVAAAVIARVSDWLPLTEWTVLSVEPDGAIQRVDDHDIDVHFGHACLEIADVVVRGGRAAIRTTGYASERMAGGTRASSSAELTVLGWPLVAGGEIVGVLAGVDFGRPRRLPTLSAEIVDALNLLIEPGAFALSNALRVARAEALSVTDDLTQLYNSRYLNEALRKETKRAMRSGWPLSLLFVDLDGFKRINDAHGHLLGSRALIEAAQIIRGSARETDIVARFGGDEFAILLPETGAEGAQMVARRLRDRIQRHNFLAERGSGNRVTASIGAATLPDVADTAEGLLQAADAAMYRVKVTGKNGIHVAGSETDGARVPAEEQELH